MYLLKLICNSYVKLTDDIPGFGLVTCKNRTSPSLSCITYWCYETCHVGRQRAHPAHLPYFSSKNGFRHSSTQCLLVCILVSVSWMHWGCVLLTFPQWTPQKRGWFNAKKCTFRGSVGILNALVKARNYRKLCFSPKRMFFSANIHSPIIDPYPKYNA